MPARKPSTIESPRVIPSKSGSRAKARCRASPKAARTAASPTGWPVATAPEPRGHALEAGFAHEIADTFAGDDQFAALAIDMAEHCFGGRDAVQPDRRLGKLHVHGRSPSV